MNGKFEIYVDKAGEYRFRLKAGNSEIILSSEGYRARAGCENGIESVRRNAPDEANYEKNVTISGYHRFNLKAKNGQVIGTSQSYSSASRRDDGIASVQTNAPHAELVEV